MKPDLVGKPGFSGVNRMKTSAWYSGERRVLSDHDLQAESNGPPSQSLCEDSSGREIAHGNRFRIPTTTC
jgi:hypothetical protein